MKSNELTKIKAAAVAPNGKYLVAGYSDNQLIILDLATQERTKIPTNLESYATAIGISADSRLIATGGVHDAVRIFNAETQQQILSIEEDTDYCVVTDLVFSSDGKYLAAAFGDYHLYITVWEVETGDFIFFTHVETDVYNIVLPPNGKEIIGASRYREILSVWDVETQKKIQGLEKGGELWGLNLAISHSGSTIAVITNKNKVILWDIATKTEQSEIPLSYSNCVSIPLICFSADDRLVAVVKTDAIKIVDLQQGRELHSFSIDKTIFSTIKFVENDAKLLTVAESGQIEFWDLSLLAK